MGIGGIGIEGHSAHWAGRIPDPYFRDGPAHDAWLVKGVSTRKNCDVAVLGELVQTAYARRHFLLCESPRALLRRCLRREPTYLRLFDVAFADNVMDFGTPGIG